MTVLLDTQMAILAVSYPTQLTSREREILIENSAFAVSIASLWEIAIKNSLGLRRDRFPFSIGEAIDRFRSAGFEILAITDHHLRVVESLPHIHRDPFDRMLVAQSKSEGWPLLTRDRLVLQYSTQFR